MKLTRSPNNDKNIINEIIIYPDIEKKIYVKKVNNKFVAGREDKKKLFSKLKLYEVEIHNSIYSTLKKIDTPDEKNNGVCSVVWF